MNFARFKKVATLFIGGALIGALVSFLIGATAVGVLGANFGSPALIVFSIAGGLIGLAAYGGYRAIKD